MPQISYEPYVEKFTYISSGAGAGQIEYHGMAKAGASAGAAVWLIKKYTYDTDGNNTDIQWASGSREFDKEWDERGTYVFS